MTVEAAIEAEIRRLHFAEHWKVGTIAAQLSVHADVVRRVLRLDAPRTPPPPRPRLIDPYVEFIAETLRRYPRLRATRIYDMLRERGYRGSARTVREHVAAVRPTPRREAFLRVESLAGEQAQIDWAHVGDIDVPGGRRALWAFVMVLAYSRAMWGELVFDLTVHSLCRSLVRASLHFGGSTRQWLFDNPKSVVIERHADAARFHPRLLELCGAMHVQPRLCAVASPEHKGKVERAIRYLRDRFLAGRSFASIEDGNRQLDVFVHDIAMARPHPRLPGVTVAQAFEAERPRLLALPDPLPPTEEVRPVAVDKTAFARLDTNLYSVPHEHAGGTLTLVADDREVRLLDGSACVAQHPRCWGYKQVLEESAHRKALLDERRAARSLKGRDLLRAQVPGVDALLARWVEGGRNLGSLVARTVKLLELYGDEILADAVAEALARGVSDIGALAVACEQRRRASGRAVPVAVELDSRIPDRDVIPHELEGYDVRRKR